MTLALAMQPSELSIHLRLVKECPVLNVARILLLRAVSEIIFGVNTRLVTLNSTKNFAYYGRGETFTDEEVLNNFRGYSVHL